jgi:hypothetical protein
LRQPRNKPGHQNRYDKHPADAWTHRVSVPRIRFVYTHDFHQAHGASTTNQTIRAVNDAMEAAVTIMNFQANLNNLMGK